MEEYISNFRDEFQSLKLNESLNKELLDKAFSKYSFYTYIPYELYRVLHLEHVNAESVTRLAVASYSYFHFILFLDKLKDGQTDVLPLDEKQRNLYTQDYIFKIHEYVFKTLAFLYPSDSDFWKEFDSIKDTFLEVENFKVDQSNIMDTLLKKSCFAEAYIIAFKYLMTENDRMNKAPIILRKFSEAMTHFHIAFQLYDDYIDLKEDLVHHQLNYYHYMGKDLQEVYPEDTMFIKALFASGIISEGLNKAYGYANEAEKEFRIIGMGIHSNWSKSLLEKIINKRHYIHALLFKTRQIATFSTKLIVENIALDRRLSLSIDFLRNQLKNNAWEDFLTNAGFGKNWVTSYVLTQIGNKDITNSLHKVYNLLVSSGGRYNEHIVEDADSINFLIRSMRLFSEAPSDDLIRRWCNFQKVNGGFSTYYKNDIKLAMKIDESADFTGWFTPQSCVTAVACWAASLYQDVPAVKHIYEKSKRFLLMNQAENGSWSSYWWVSDIYATTFSVLALLDDPKVDANVIDRAIRYIVKLQQPSGYWEGYHEPSVFFTAMAINVLIEQSKRTKRSDLKQAIETGISWLVTNQYDDGSWKTTRILRLPLPNELNPNTVNDWRRTSFGLNCLVDDHKRVFTTATVYNTLNNYAKYCL